MAVTCRKCSKPLVKCSSCNGKGEWTHLLITNTCSKCKGTGYICPDSKHGANWQ